VHFYSNQPKRALVSLSVNAYERSYHETHVGIMERKRLLLAGPYIRPRDIASDDGNARGALEVADCGWLLTRTAEQVKGGHRAQTGCLLACGEP
jgi:hypothetical protein